MRAFLFDLDGVIVDTAKYHYLAWQQIANELGFEFTLAHNERLKGVSRMRSLEILLEIGGVQVDEVKKNELADKKNQQYVEYILKLGPSEILPGAKGFIEECRAHPIKIGLGSASKNANTIIQRLKIGHLFDVIIDGYKVAEAKPDPAVFLKGAMELGVNPHDCVVFEDAEAGVDAAIAANMLCVGVGSKEILHKANIVIAGFDGLGLTGLLKLLPHAGQMVV